MPDSMEPKRRKSAAMKNSADRMEKCMAIVAKNVPLTDELMSLLKDCRLLENQKKSASSNRRQTDLFASMATMDAASLRQLAACLRLSGHPLMAELLLQTVSQMEAEFEDECMMMELLPHMILERLGLPETDEALEQLRQLFDEAHLMSWCCHLFDPAGADVMSLRRQHAEETWRAAKEVREKTAELEEMKAKLSALELILKERDATVDDLESRLSQLTISVDSVSCLKSYRSAVALARSEIHRFFEEAESAATIPDGESHLDDDTRLLTAFREEFTVGFLARCRGLLEERRQMTRELADRNRRIVALIRNGNKSAGDINQNDGEPVGAWMEDEGTGRSSSFEHKRSPALARAWDEIAASHPDEQQHQQQHQHQLEPRRRYSVLPGIPHSHRKATKREAAASVKKREPAGKPLSANVVSLF